MAWTGFIVGPGFALAYDEVSSYHAVVTAGSIIIQNIEETTSSQS